MHPILCELVGGPPPSAGGRAVRRLSLAASLLLLAGACLWSFVPICHLPFMLAGGMVEFRRSLAASFLFKGLLWASQQLEGDAPAYASPFPDSYRSGRRCCCWFWSRWLWVRFVSCQQVEGAAPAYASPFPDAYRSGRTCLGLLPIAASRRLLQSCLCHMMRCAVKLVSRMHLAIHPASHHPFTHPHSFHARPSFAAVQPYERPPSHGLQYFSAVPGEDIVGQPVRHMAVDQQASI